MPSTITATPITDKYNGKSTYADYYETSMVNNTMVNNTMGHGASPPRLDVSNLSGYKSTSIVTPSLSGGNIKVNINH
jgi:hypothetical protein